MIRIYISTLLLLLGSSQLFAQLLVPTPTSPACEDFSTQGVPNGWTVEGNEVLKFGNGSTNSAGFGASNVDDHTTGSANNTFYAWMDGSTPVGDSGAILISPFYDISGLISPQVSIWYFSNNTTNPGDNNSFVFEIFDGIGWYELDSIAADNPNWVEYTVDLNSLPVSIPTFTQLRIRLLNTASSGNQFYNDLLIDDICVREAPLCFVPSNVSIGTVTATSAEVDFQINSTNVDQYYVVYGPQGFDVNSGAGDTLVVLTPPAQLLNLMSQTEYDVYIQSDCGPINGLSDFTTVTSFTTPCDVLSAPVCQTFPTNTLPPDCYSFENDITGWEISSSFNSEGGTPTDFTPGGGTEFIFADFSDIAAGDTATFVTADIDITTLTNPVVSFYLWAGINSQSIQNNNGFNTLAVDVYNFANDLWFPIESLQQDSATWVRHSIDLNAIPFPLNNAVRFRFHAISTAFGSDFYNDLAVDDICVEERMGCESVANIEVSSVTGNTADVSFFGTTNATQYTLVYGPAPYDPTMSGGTTLTLSGTSTTITGLMPQTTYQFYLQTDCGGDGLSGFTLPRSFTTECQAAVAPVCQTFPTDELPPSCYSFENDVTGWKFNGTFNAAGGSPGDYTPGGGTEFIFADFSDIAPAQPASLVTESYDVSGLTDPLVTYYVYSAILDSAVAAAEGLNTLTVDIYNTNTDMWMQVDSFSQNAPDWVPHFIDVNALPFAVGSTFKLRFNAISTATGDDFLNDIGLDDICIDEKPLNPDVAVTAVTAPTNGVSLTAAEPVTVSLQNVGFSDAANVSVSYTINGGAPVTESLAALAQQTSQSFTFATQADLSQSGSYDIVVYVSAPNDTNLSNDTLAITVLNTPVVTALPYQEDFESGNGFWLASAANAVTWELGMPSGAVIDMAAPGGANSWVTDLDGQYINNTLTTLEGPVFDFSALIVDPVLSFDYYIHSEEDWDGLWVEVSTDQGVTYTKLGSDATGINWYNNSIDQWWDDESATGSGWVSASHPIVGAAGQSGVRIRFVFDSDGTQSSFDGAGIDNILIISQPDVDLAVTAITNGSECGSATDQVTATIVNNGLLAATMYDVTYTVNGGTPVTETVMLSISPEGSLDYTFTTPFNSLDGSAAFDIQVSVAIAGDEVAANDAASFTFVPVPLYDAPYYQDFESFPGFDAADFTDIGNWNTGSGHNLPSTAAFTNLYSFVTSGELVSPQFGQVQAGDSIAFDYRIVDFSSGTVATTTGFSIVVGISTDCGDTYVPVATIDDTNHTPTTSYTNFSIDLTPYAGQNVKVNWLATWTAGDYYFDLDNINFKRCPGTFGATVDVVDVSADSLGSVTISNVSGGVAPYMYAWSDGSTSDTLTGLSQGDYTVTVTDRQGCTEVLSVVVGFDCNSTAPLVAQLATTPATSGLADGTASLTVTGGTGPYAYLWATGATTASLNGIEGGDYSYTVTDDNGCTLEGLATVGITCPDSLGLSTTVTPSTSGMPNGTATVLVALGQFPYSYAWSSGDTLALATDLAEGTYTVTVTDANGCTDQATVSVASGCPADLGLVATATPELSGEGSGTAMVMATNGTPPYTSMWSNGMTGDTIELLAAGTYGVTVTDANGCTDSTTVQVEVECPTDLGLSTVSSGPNSGEIDGNILVGAISGQAPYTYAWSTGSTTPGIDNLDVGTYTVTVTDQNGCMDSISVVLSIECPDSLGVSVVVTNELASGTLGQIDLDIDAGAAPYVVSYDTISINLDQAVGAIPNLPAGDYSIIVEDANGCADTLSVSVLFDNDVSLSGIPSLERAVLAPNPTQGMATLMLHFATAQDVSVSTVTLTGQLLNTQQQQGMSDGTFAIDLSDLPEGVYFIRISAEGGTRTLRLVRTY